MSKYVTVNQAAEITGLSPAIIRVAYDDGLISGIKTPGGHRRVLEADLEKLTQ